MEQPLQPPFNFWDVTILQNAEHLEDVQLSQRENAQIAPVIRNKAELLELGGSSTYLLQHRATLIHLLILYFWCISD